MLPRASATASHTRTRYSNGQGKRLFRHKHVAAVQVAAHRRHPSQAQRLEREQDLAPEFCDVGRLHGLSVVVHEGGCEMGACWCPRVYGCAVRAGACTHFSLKLFSGLQWNRKSLRLPLRRHGRTSSSTLPAEYYNVSLNERCQPHLLSAVKEHVSTGSKK